jgi:hypothetical protein
VVEALRYKPEGHGIDFRWCLWNFSLTYSFRPHYGPGVESASNRNEYQEYFLGGKGDRCVGLKTLPPSCAGCLKIWEPQHPANLRAPQGLSWECLPCITRRSINNQRYALKYTPPLFNILLYYILFNKFDIPHI